MKTYLELVRLETFEERYSYLKLNGRPSELTFNGHRLLNQYLYQRNEKWKEVRRKVIIRDNGCDLGISDRPLNAYIMVHHINPITVEQVINEDPMIFSMNNLICCSKETHNAIHYGSLDRLTPSKPTIRRPGDTKLW